MAIEDHEYERRLQYWRELLTTTCKHSVAVLGKFVKSESKSFTSLDGHLKSVKFWLAHPHTNAVKVVQGKLAAIDVVLQTCHNQRNAKWEAE